VRRRNEGKRPNECSYSEDNASDTIGNCGQEESLLDEEKHLDAEEELLAKKVIDWTTHMGNNTSHNCLR